jgi:hypothetical protein
MDNDGDTFVDCDDPECIGTPPCVMPAPAPVLNPLAMLVVGIGLLLIGWRGILTLVRRH